MRESFAKALPSESTIRGWVRKVDSSPGFSKTALDYLLAAVQSSKEQNKKVVCSFVLDEMHLKEHMYFDGSKFHGGVDIGDGQPDCDDDIQPAKHCLVFLLTCINSNWKLPIAHFFIDNMSGAGKQIYLNILIDF